MFGIRNLRRRVEALETWREVITRERNCASGRHNWEMFDLDYINKGIRCKHCYKKQEQKS